MITPQFSVDQDDEFVYIDIKAPYLKASNIEFFVENDLFIFSLHPYYLRLRFPGLLIDDEQRSNTRYDLNTGHIIAKIPKMNRGESFKDLDMLNKLLSRKGEMVGESKGPLIQELNSEKLSADDDAEIFKKAQQFNWEIEQELVDESSTSILGEKYGFNGAYSDIIGISIMNGNDINELEEPEKTTRKERKEIRESCISGKFDPEHYLADFHDDEIIRDLINTDLDLKSTLTDQDNDTMTRYLSQREIIVSNPRSIYLGLIAFIFGILYDNRITVGQSTVESPWTIGKLIPQMAFLDDSLTTMNDVIITCTKMALSYPLYRHLGLVNRIWQDVTMVLKQGKRCLLHYMLMTYRQFMVSDRYQVYNTIWFHDYCIWLQNGCNDGVIESLAADLDRQLRGFVGEEIQIGDWKLKELHEMGVSTGEEAGRGEQVPDSDDEPTEESQKLPLADSDDESS